MIENTPTHDRVSWFETASDVLVCPDCSKPFTANHCRCCTARTLGDDNIPSFLPETDDSDQHLSETRLKELAAATTNGPIRTAADEVLAGHTDRTDILSKIFDVRKDLWQVLVAEHINGRCLDLYPGYGRRSMVLAELTDSVYAVDPSLAKLRITAGRDDYDSSNRVRPIHTDVQRLPFSNESFDTIVADFTGKRDVESKLRRLRECLTDDGSMVFTADGWPTTAGITSLVGSDRTLPEQRGDLRPGTAAGYRELARSAGFDNVSVYALFPSGSRPVYAFAVDSDRALPTIFRSYANDRDHVGNAIESTTTLLNDTGLMEYCYPTYLVVCTNTRKEPAFEFADPLVVQGRTRSVVLDMADTGIETVWKIPNRRAHRPFTENENSVITELRSSDKDIVSTIPDGEAIESQFGPIRREQPVDGHSIDEKLDGGVESYERVLRLGFDWLIEFQQSFRDESVVHSPATVSEELTVEPVGLSPPPIDDPVETFTTPAHGDFMTGNIYHENGQITSVIDWEHGTLAASPMVDAGFLLLNAASWLVSDFTERIKTVLCGHNEYAACTRSVVRDYCDAVGLPYRSFELYLPAAYIHRIVRNWRLNAVSSYTEQMDNRIQRTQILFDAIDEMTISSG